MLWYCTCSISSCCLRSNYGHEREGHHKKQPDLFNWISVASIVGIIVDGTITLSMLYYLVQKHRQSSMKRWVENCGKTWILENFNWSMGTLLETFSSTRLVDTLLTYTISKFLRQCEIINLWPIPWAIVRIRTNHKVRMCISILRSCTHITSKAFDPSRWSSA